MKSLLNDSFSNITFIFNFNVNRFTYVHPSLSAFLKENDEPSGLSSLIHPEDRELVYKQFNDLLNGSFNGNSQFRIVVKGEEQWFTVTPFLIDLHAERLLCGNAIDTTAEEHNLYSMEKYANKKNSILQILSHELKGPLNLATMLSKDLRAKVKGNSLVINHLRLISDLIHQSIILIEDLTNREFLETIHVSLVRKRLNIVEKVKEYVEEWKRSQSLVQREFIFQSSPKNIYAVLDEPKFMQVLNNLVSNAVKFTEPGGCISIAIQESASSVVLYFSDDGIGIPRQLQPFIFDKYTAARREGLHGEASMGLGLSIVKTIIEWHNGKIEVDSVENKGTTFKIEFPKE
jgi:two-component system sensor histidine kinase VicK